MLYIKHSSLIFTEYKNVFSILQQNMLWKVKHIYSVMLLLKVKISDIVVDILTLE